jgi:uncharacterized membrane protein (DUF4010 family)
VRDMPESVNTLLTPYLISIIVATGIGLIIGLEREFRKTNEQDHFAGIRTFPLVCLLGCIITFVGNLLSLWIIVASLLAFIGLVSVAYYVRSTKGHAGITTEISLIITFILGIMTSQQLIKESLAAMVITTTLLTMKGQFHSFILKITEDELFAFVKFIILCLLLFPFLPDASFGPNALINPREIGFIVVVVSSLSFIGYLLAKFAGTNKGILLTALFGGMVSSTAVAWMFANRARKTDAGQTTLYSAGIVLASSIMFLRVIILALIFNKALAFSLLVPCTLIFISGCSFASFFFWKYKLPTSNAPIQLGNPVNILNALAFGVMYVAIAYIVFYGEKILGNKGLVLSGFVSGLADVDAITITMAKLSEGVSLGTSVLVVILATVSNTLVKLIIVSLQGGKNASKKVFYGMGTMLLVAMMYILFKSL